MYFYKKVEKEVYLYLSESIYQFNSENQGFSRLLVKKARSIFEIITRQMKVEFEEDYKKIKGDELFLKIE